MLPNIYFVGKAGAGKSYSAEFLKQTYGYKTAKFAYPIYDIARNYFEMKNKDRKLLQIIGTDAGRIMINENIWINRLVEDLKIVRETEKYLQRSHTYYVSDDVRFKNEHIALKSAGWVGIYLDVPDDVRIQRLKNRDGTAQEATLQHVSELEIDTFKDELIKIDATQLLENMYKDITNLLNKLKYEG